MKPIHSLEERIEILKSILIDKNDTVGILATGYGKSVCYQLPFLYHNMKKNVIVISPLISLMEDQFEKLEAMNIPVFAFHSGIKKKDRELIKDRRNIKNRMSESLDDYIEDLYSN